MSRSKDRPTHFGAPCRPAGLIIFVVLALGLILPQAALAADTANTWTITGSLAIARNGHTATLLPNGRVLVAGGQNLDYSSPHMNSAELYDPATGTWTATGSLHAPRAVHTATLLANGMVLVAGGADSSGTLLTSAELYDPAAGTWTITGPLSWGRQSHTATLLTNGKVLVAGGYYSQITAELYDPATGTWTPTVFLNTGRNQHTATLLGNGKVLVAGGHGGTSLANAELYDPAVGTWTYTGSLTTDRYGHTANLLRSGLVLVAGGSKINIGTLASAELYDPATGTWTGTGSLNTGRNSNTATLLNNGMVLVAGGANINGLLLASAELYDQAAGTWTATGSLNTGRHGHTATLLANGQVLAAGGYDGWYLASAELYHSNAPPVANAGLDQTVHVGTTVNLNGSGSSDPDGNVPLTYKWRFVSKPAGSVAQLSDDTAVSPSFVADTLSLESWVLELVVTDSLGLPSAPAKVMISTANSAPVADAGPNQAVTLVSTTVYLGTEPNRQSYDPDGDPLTYSWYLTSAPPGSTAALANPTSATPSFVPDKHGDYVVQLVVSDPWTASAPATMKASFANVAPVANAGPAQALVIGAMVNLNGSGSRDANGDPLTYKWGMASAPADSGLGSFTSTAMGPSFKPDVPGDYVVQLIVNDGVEDSQASTAQIHVAPSRCWLTDRLRDVIYEIAHLPPEAFKNRIMRNTLILKLTVVIVEVNVGRYKCALNKIEDIIPKTNGCAVGGRPDHNDWVIACSYQEMIYPDLMDIASHLAVLAGQ